MSSFRQAVDELCEGKNRLTSGLNEWDNRRRREVYVPSEFYGKDAAGNPTKPSKAYINKCGTLNLKTGKNLYFNVLQDWEPGSSSLYLYQEVGADPYSANANKTMLWLVGGHGTDHEGVQRVDQFLDSQSHRHLGFWRLMGEYLNTPEDMAKIADEIGKNSVRFGTYD